jgi:hypothetical protein
MPTLSERETQVLDGLVKGHANKVIARTCDITEATVKVHMKSILRKIRVGNRTRPNSQPCTRALCDATDGLPQQWRMLEELDGATADAIVFAVARGWMIVEAGHSIRLTDAGRRLMESQA